MFDKSFYLTRTNPKLSGNIKVVVSTDDKIYIESYQANKTLSTDRFKHVEVKKEEYYKEVVPIFFKDVENSTIFETRKLNDASDIYNDYSFQFDDTYYSGAQFTQDTWYLEEYEYIAPIYINKKALPKSFIIFRIDGPGTLSEASSGNNFRSELINKWKFVERYDLTKTSVFGEWLNKNFVDDSGIPDYPLIIKNGDIELSTVSGIDIKKGGWIDKSLTLKDALSDNSPIFKTEEFFTDLWESNDLIYPDILNIKFLYDDNPATPDTLRKYTINRYSGFYIDEEQLISSVSPFKGFELNKPDINLLEEYTSVQISEIPFLRDNIFIKIINDRIYSIDPILYGWNENKNYWIEWNSKYYRLERVLNIKKDLFDPNQIIGDYIYRVVSDIIIKHDINNPDFIHSEDLNNIDDESVTKVLITELSTDKNRIEVKYKQEFNNITAYNIIENVNTTYIRYKRIYEYVEVNNSSKYLFKIVLDSDIDNNLFNIPHFNEADIHLMKQDNNYFVIKQYPITEPNVGGKYYLYTDYGIDIDKSVIKIWINNGNVTKDSLYYNETLIENIDPTGTIPFFDIIRISFTDIKDFDFDRIETDYTRYEYEKQYSESTTLEPKLYAKEWRDINIGINTIQSERARRIPITDINNRPLNIRYLNGETDPINNSIYTDTDLYYKDYDGKWMLYEGVYNNETFSDYRTDTADLKRSFYREENYIWRLEDSDNTLISEIDFITSSDPSNIYEELKWGNDSLSEISTDKTALPNINSTDPNQTIDKNYIPVSSEYIGSDELWEIRNENLTSIWDKNQSICKWGSLNSMARQNQSYRLNYSIDMGGLTNREPNPNTNIDYPLRKDLCLDYFYRFGIVYPEQYQYYSLHLTDTYFDIDKYYSTEFDYFAYLFDSDNITSDGIIPNKKYSLFNARNIYNDPSTIFKGLRYNLLDVDKIIFDQEELDINNVLYIDDIITRPNNLYDGYKFCVIFSKKSSLSENNPGNSNGNMGIDIYLNDKWKNVLINIYINSDDNIQILDPVTNTIVDAEACPIDLWYNDNLESEETDPIKWEDSEFKINGFGIGLRPRDLMLWEFVNILDNYNFEPNDSNREIVNFIHIYEDGSSKIMDYTNTDFIIDTDLPDEIVLKEKAYIVNKIDDSNIPNFDINNTISNRIIKDDDAFLSIGTSIGDPSFTSDGIRVGSINDINSYNNYPIAKSIEENSIDSRKYWELDTETDPSIFRYNGPYFPIFKSINLFRPYGYNALKQNNQLPILSRGNWKFYDPNSDIDSKPIVSGYGIIDEIIFSKVNTTTNILKINDPDNKEKSIYPMVDEYGYDFDSRYLFASNWEQNFYYESKQITVPPNPELGVAGYCIRYDGVSDYLKLPDNIKTNLETFVPESVNFNNYINNEPDGERSIRKLTFSNIQRGFVYNSGGGSSSYTLSTINNQLQFLDIDLISGIDYEIQYKLLSYTTSLGYIPTTNNVLGVIIEVLNDPNDPTQTGSKYLLLTETEQPYGSLDTDCTICDVSLHNNGLNVGSNNYKVKFNTSIYNTSKTSQNNLIHNQLPNNYINGSVVSVRVYTGLFNTTNDNNGDIATLDLTFRISSSLDNFLDIDTGNILIETNKNNEYPILLEGYFKKIDESESVLNYKSITKPIDGSIYTETELNTLYPLWKDYAGLSTNPKPGRVGNPFTGTVPSNWSDSKYLDIAESVIHGSGTILNNILSNGFSQKGLYHYLEYGSQDPSTIPVPVSTSPAINYRFGQIVVENEFFKISGIVKNLNFPIYRGFIESVDSRLSPFRISNQTPFDFEPDYNTRIEDGKNIVYVGEPVSSIPVTLPYNTIRLYKMYRTNTIKFTIVPSNEKSFDIKVTIKNGESISNRLSSTTIMGNINNALPNNYICTIVKDNKNLVEYKISNQLQGSYFNFDIIIDPASEKDLSIVSTIRSGDIVTTSSKLCKTSLKQDSIRNTGLLKDITIEFYVKIDPESWTKRFETILYKGLDTGTDIDVWQTESFHDYTYIIGKFDNTNRLGFKTCHKKLNKEYIHNTLITNTDINDGIWHHIACIVDNSNLSKSIYIDGSLDSSVSNYLEPTDINENIFDDSPDEREMVAQFLDNRSRFIPGVLYDRLGIDSVMATKIRNNLTDSDTIYWYDTIRGVNSILSYDKKWMHKNWAIDIVEGFESFRNNYKQTDYYICASTDNRWDLLIATDSVITNGRRNFEGYIDELRIWNYVRTEKQLKDNSRFILRPEAYLNPLESLVTYIRFDYIDTDIEIQDLMSGYSIKEMDRWSKTTTTFINDGNTESESDSKTSFSFERSYYDSEPIIIDPDNIDVVVSDIELVGYSDERNIATPPEPLVYSSNKPINQPIFIKTKAMIDKIDAKKLRFNVKKKIFDYTKLRITKPVDPFWWKLKDLATRKVETKIKTFQVVIKIDKKGKDWLNDVRNLVRKRR